MCTPSSSRPSDCRGADLHASERAPTQAAPPFASTAPTTPPEVVRLLEMKAGLPAAQVEVRLFASGRHEEVGVRARAFYLVEMDARRLYQAFGHSSTERYAETRLRLDRRRTAELLRVGRKLLELRLLDRAYCAGELGWSQVLVVARMATPENEAAWVEKAKALDARALQRLASRSREGSAPRADGDEKGLPEIRVPIQAKVDALTFAAIEQAQRKLADELGRDVDLAETLRVLAGDLLATQADGTVPGRKPVDASIYRVEVSECCRRHRQEGAPPLVDSELGHLPIDAEGPGRASARSEAIRCDAGVRTWHGHDHREKDVKTPNRMRKKVKHRDRYRCRSCHVPRAGSNLMVHHIEFRSHGGRTIPQNLITLCEDCHGLVHADLLVIRGERVEEALFLDAQGRPVDAPVLVGLNALFQATQPPEPAPTGGASAGAGAATATTGSTAAAANANEPGGDEVTLARVPREVDGGWWQRHAHLVKDRGEHRQLTFVAGRPIELEPTYPLPVPPAEQAFAGVVGQAKRVERLTHAARVARATGKRYPHTLLSGPAGTGKSTLARGIAATAQQPLLIVDASLMVDRSAMVRLLAGLEEGTVLFLDEVHALPPAVQDTLLLALAEQKLALLLSDGTRTRGVTVRLPAFTLVAATTDEGALSTALRSRFKQRETLVHLEQAELAEVVQVAAKEQGAEVTPEGALRIAEAARGTPRAARDLFDKALGDVDVERASATVGGAREVTRTGVDRMLVRLGYDADLLDEREQAYMKVLRGSPCGMSLGALASALDLPRRVVRELVEPELQRRGLVQTGPTGRVALPGAIWAARRRMGSVGASGRNDAVWMDRVNDRAALILTGSAPIVRRTPPAARSSA